MQHLGLNKQFVTLLIEGYRRLPSLWNVKSPLYKDKLTKREDYVTLLNSLLTIDPLLKLNELKRKIAKIRTCYRRELKKISESKASGAKGRELYVPALWYFDKLHFLCDSESERLILELKKEKEKVPEYNDDDEEEEEEDVQQLSMRNTTRKSKSSRMVSEKRKTFDDTTTETSDNIEPEKRCRRDEAQTFSETWTILFRKLSYKQQLYAKRCIDEILYLGQADNLNANSHRKIEQSQTYLIQARSTTPDPLNSSQNMLNEI